MSLRKEEADERHVYIAVDGDRVGETLETLLARRDVEAAARYSQEVAHLFANLRGLFESFGANIIFCEGDSLLATMFEADFDPDILQDLPCGPCTFSIGLAWDSRTVLMALKMAKALGRNGVFSLLGNNR